MPIYEYWCNSCNARVEIYLSSPKGDAPCCPKCKNNSLQRRFSTFMVQSSYKDVYDNILSDSQLMRGMMNNDPKALAEWNKKMSSGEPVAPEYQETLERMERGIMPSSTDSEQDTNGKSPQTEG
ncbi:MAG: zinc ribbon domain-containing protein [Dehalococcoidia bacterium]